jgi:hypothetical protein
MIKTMIKRIVLGTLLVGLIGILVAGAIIRTVDKTENVAEARGLEREGETGAHVEGQHGQGFGAGAFASESQPQGRGGYGQGGARGSEVERQVPNYEAQPEASLQYEGTVIRAPADGVDLLIETGGGEKVKVGTGPGYMEAQGFTLQVGERVQVSGYLEGDELKAAQVTRLSDGQTITLRDDFGRPAWSGAGRRAAERQEATGQTGRGQGGLGQGGQGQGGLGGEGREGAPGDGTGSGQAQVDAWLAVEGTVSNVDSYALVVLASGNQEITVDGRAWRFAQEQGFWTQAGDQVTLRGFLEGDDFEVGQITDTTTSLSVHIREESGRPLWAGRGRRGG